MFYVFVIMVYIFWYEAGIAGLKDAAIVSSLFLVALGVQNFLQTFWGKKRNSKPQPPPSYERGEARTQGVRKGFGHQSNEASELRRSSALERRRARAGIIESESA